MSEVETGKFEVSTALLLFRWPTGLKTPNLPTS
jgi:hypothetical protein